MAVQKQPPFRVKGSLGSDGMLVKQKSDLGWIVDF